jgi:hypothetical protein
MNLTLVIPITVLCVKLLVQVVSRDNLKDLLRSITNLPLELLLIAMSFMFGALSGISQSYLGKFTTLSDADLWAILMIFFIFLLCLAIHSGTKFVYILGTKLSVAASQFQGLVQGPITDSSNINPGANVARGGRILWAMAYCIMMVTVLILKFGTAVVALSYVLHLVQ